MRNTYIYPPGPSMRIIGDIFRYCAGEHAQVQLHFDQRLSHAGSRRDRRSRAGLHAGRRPRIHPHGHRGGPGYRRLRAAPELLLGHRHEPLHGDRQDARRARAVGQDRQGVPSEESEIHGAAHALPDLRLEPGRAGRLQQRAAHLRSKRWPPCSATRNRCTPTRSTKPSRCPPIFRRASPATPRSTSRKRPASPTWSIPGPAAITWRASPTS